MSILQYMYVRANVWHLISGTDTPRRPFTPVKHGVDFQYPEFWSGLCSPFVLRYFWFVLIRPTKVSLLNLMNQKLKKQIEYDYFFKNFCTARSIRVELFSTFFDFRKATFFCWSGIFLGSQFLLFSKNGQTGFWSKK